MHPTDSCGTDSWGTVCTTGPSGTYQAIQTTMIENILNPYAAGNLFDQQKV